MTINPERTRKIESILGIVGTLLIVSALFVYILDEPDRIEMAQDEILVIQLEDAMTLYAENCSICHGLAGEGIGANPALDSDALRTMPTSNLTRVIADGRYNTSMPAWGQDSGGPLSSYQVGELVALVKFGDWQATSDRVVNMGLAPLVPFTTDPDSSLLDAVASLPDGTVLQNAITVYAAQCVACHGSDGLGTSIAPALNDTAARNKTSAELERVINNGIPGTLMAGWSSVLLPGDVSALITLIQRWDEVPTGAIPAPEMPIAVTAESLAHGAQLYSSSCSRCHGPEGQGTQRAPALNVRSFLTETSDPAIQQIITLGIPGTSMPAWGDRLITADIQAIIGFIRQWESTAPDVAVPVRVGKGGPPWMSSSTTTIVPTPVSSDEPQSVLTPGVQVTAVPTDVHQPTAQTGAGTGQGQEGGPALQHAQTEDTTGQQGLDWRAIALVTGILALAFTLIFLGYPALQKRA